MNKTANHSFAEFFLPGVLTLIAAAPIAFAMDLFNKSFKQNPQVAVLSIGFFSVVLIAVAILVYLMFNLKDTNPGKLGLVVFIAVMVILTAIYIFQTYEEVLLPADILIWSESDFVNDILKHQIRYPLYTEQSNNESFIYTPGAPWATYQLSRLLGKSSSMPAFRLIQVCFTLFAVFLAAGSSYRLIEYNSGKDRFENLKWWGAFGVPFLFLLATNTLTNPFVHNLHNDALALLVSIFAFWLVVEYMIAPRDWILILMALVPGLGYLVKQSLAVWAVLYIIYLLFVMEPRSIRNLILVGGCALGGIALAVVAGYLVWGEHYIYWTITVLLEHPRSLLRGFQHLLEAGMFYMIGLFAGYVFLRGVQFKRLFWAWFVWLSLLLVETQTSGIAWMSNHMGPGSLIAGIWFIPAVVRMYPIRISDPIKDVKLGIWLRGFIAAALLIFVLNGLFVVRIPVKKLPQDVNRYIKEIEIQFEEDEADRILLDAGTWVYLDEGIEMRDRAPSIGDRGLAGVGDFSGIISRIEEGYYSKILLRNFHSPDFWYDHYLWSNSSGIRNAMLDNYFEVGSIDAVASDETGAEVQYLFQEISILAPMQPR